MRTESQALTLPSEHGPLHATLTLREASPGIVVLAHAALALDRRDGLLAAKLREAGLSTLSIDLIARQEERFADAQNHVPLLAKRLLDFLGALKQRMLLDQVPPQPLGLYAANATSPVAVRVAALRDHDIAALVCRGGLIDRAGMLYLRALEAPLLMLIEERETHEIAAAERALREIPGERKLTLIPEIGIDYAASPGFTPAAQATAEWFLKYFKARTAQEEPKRTRVETCEK